MILSDKISRLKRFAVETCTYPKVIGKPKTAVLLADVLKILEEEEMKGWVNNFETLAIEAKALGFNHVDLYIPDKKTEETVAFTFSKSEKYSKIIQDVEIGKVVVPKQKLQELADLLENRLNHLGMGSVARWFEVYEKKFAEMGVESVKPTKKEAHK